MKKSIFFYVMIVFLLAFKTGRTEDRVVSVYYYPWYGTNTHWPEGYLRNVLVPAQPPQLGEYSSRSTTVINRHIDWSESYGLDIWICSWWGPNSGEDITIKDYISAQMAGHPVKYCLFYESAGLLNLQNDQIYFDDAKITTFRSHFDYIAKTYFSDSSYYKVDGRPVVYLYLTRTFTGAYEKALKLVRDDMFKLGYDVFLVGDEIYWGDPDENRISTLDAITAYNMHGPSQYAGYPLRTNFIEAVAAKYSIYKRYADKYEVRFIPDVMPGFNDRGVRLQADHYIITTRVHPDSSFSSTLSHFADMAERFIDDSLNAVCVTSFNEWHEDTQIEPTIVSDSTNNDQSGKYDYTKSYYYKGYGTSLLEVILNKFGNPNPVGIDRADHPVTNFSLEQNYPNPFNPTTVISYRLLARRGGAVVSQVKLAVYNILGQKVRTLVKEKQAAGKYRVTFNGEGLPSGVYYYRLQAGDFTETKKMILLR